MRLFTTLVCFLLAAPALMAQEFQYAFNPPVGTDLSTPFGIYVQNGARGLSGPWDLDGDGKRELFVAQHSGAGGRVHVLEENSGSWSLVYSTAVIDSSASANNVRHAIAADLDNDGRWEIVTLMGNGYKAANKVDSVAAVGMYVWEHDGVQGSDNYGTKPSSVASFYSLDGFTSVASAYSQVLDAKDLDGDGQQELLVAANGPSANDLFYALSVTGDYETNGLGSTFESWAIELRAGPRLDGNLLGGGSPIAALAGDFNGDGNMDISFHSWNNFALFNGTSTGQNTYALPTAQNTNPFIKVTSGDWHALFGGTVYDIDEDGNDEVFYANYYDNKVYVVDYSSGDNVLEIDASKVSAQADAIDIGSSGGITVGDLDRDGNMELIVGGRGYTGTQWSSGQPSQFIRVAEYDGVGDPKVNSSYTVYTLNTGIDADSLGFHRVVRDSLGTISTRYAMALSKQGATRIDSDPVFPSNVVYIDDADGDGEVQVALSFQGVDDSLFVYDEVWTTFQRTGQADTSYYVLTQRPGSGYVNPRRDFVRVYSFPQTFALGTTSRHDVAAGVKLEASYPNPFNDQTTFRFSLASPQQVTARVYDVQGRLIRTLTENALFEAGPNQLRWNGMTDGGIAAASGVYLFRMEYGRSSLSTTVLLVR